MRLLNEPERGIVSLRLSVEGVSVHQLRIRDGKPLAYCFHCSGKVRCSGVE